MTTAMAMATAWTLAAVFLGDCSQSLTGNCYSDLGLGSLFTGVLVAVLWFSRRMGWAWLEKLAEGVLAKKNGPQPTPPGQPAPPTPPATEPAPLPELDPNDPALQLPTFLALASTSGRLRKVALPFWLTILLQMIPVLKSLVEQALDELARQLGREPTPAEVKEVAAIVHGEWLSGKRKDGTFTLEQRAGG